MALPSTYLILMWHVKGRDSGGGIVPWLGLTGGGDEVAEGEKRVIVRGWRVVIRMLLLKSAYKRKPTNPKHTNKSSSLPSFQRPQSNQSNQVARRDVLALDLGQSPQVADVETGPELKVSRPEKHNWLA